MIPLKKIYIIPTILLVFFSTIVNASVFPSNQLELINQPKSNITQELFDEIIDQFENTYKPIIKMKGGILKIQRMWSANEINAFAGRFYPLFSITIMGGLARHQFMTKDALTLSLCHEMGHLLGSAPTKKKIPNRWASVEGQADYFTTLKCARRIWEKDDNIQIIKEMEISPYIESASQNSFKVLNQIALCIRSTIASFHLSKIMEGIFNDGPINFDTPDQTIVAETLPNHPSSQCRLDTFLQGALCEIDYHDELSKNNPKKGACNLSTNHTWGIRPLCWYNPDQY